MNNLRFSAPQILGEAMNYRVAAALLGVFALLGCSQHDSDSSATQVAASQNAHTASSRCEMDTFNGRVVPHDGTEVSMSVGQKFTAHGWLVDPTMHPPGNFSLRLTSAAGKAIRNFAGQTGGLRIDVANALKSESAVLSGFDVTVDLGSIPIGTYRVFAEGKGWQCDMATTLIIKPAG